MLTPNKFVSLDDSVLSKLPLVCEQIGGEITINELYRVIKSAFDGVDEFIYAIDVLFVIGRIDVNQNGVVRHVV